MPREIVFRRDREAGLDILIDASGRNLREIGDACGISRHAVSNWRRVPINRVLLLEERFGVPRWEMRPDIYPPPAHRRYG